MKHSLTALVLAGVLTGTVLLAGCGKTPAPSSAAPESQVSAAAPASEAPAAPASEAAASESEPEADAAVTLTGTVIDATMHQFTLTTAAGEEYSVLLTDDTRSELADGLLDGMTLQVTGTQSADGTVTADVLADAAPAAEVELTGTVSNASMHSFTLTTADDVTVQVLKTDDTVTTLANGLAEGGSVTVTGSQDGDTVTATQITDAA